MLHCASDVGATNHSKGAQVRQAGRLLCGGGAGAVHARPEERHAVHVEPVALRNPTSATHTTVLQWCCGLALHKRLTAGARGGPGVARLVADGKIELAALSPLLPYHLKEPEIKFQVWTYRVLGKDTSE